MKPHILVADDDPNVIAAIRLLLNAEGMTLTAVSTPADLLTTASEQSFDAILLDLNYQLDTTSGNEGLALVSKLATQEECPPLAVMTGWGTVDIAVEAMKRGARDFIQKPWENERLLLMLSNLVRMGRSEAEGRRLKQENRFLRDQLAPEGMVVESPAMKAVWQQIKDLAQSHMTMLLTGENGTGKSLLAEALHRHSPRADRPFIAVNMGAIPDSLFESEMFGHVKGAFTDARGTRMGRFECARGGTLFLDEIADIPLHLQAKLLRVLEDGKFEKVGSSKTQAADVRLVSATNRNLEDLTNQGRFRRDLLYRLNTVEIRVPPLRERFEDIPVLANHFLRAHAQKYRKAPPELEPEARDQLHGYPWPGNVRELSHLMERVLFQAKGKRIGVQDLALPITPETQTASSRTHHLNQTLDDIEKHTIQTRLKHFKGNAVETARSLGLSRSAFYRRLEKYDL